MRRTRDRIAFKLEILIPWRGVFLYTITGWYCAWLLQSVSGVPLTLEVLEADVSPTCSDCRYDGVVIYEGGTTDGKRHGKLNTQGLTDTSRLNIILFPNIPKSICLICKWNVGSRWHSVGKVRRKYFSYTAMLLI